MAQICSQSSTLLSSVEELEIREGVFPSDYPEIYEGEFRPDIEDDIDRTQWLELFRPFTAVKALQVSSRMVRLVVAALQELTGEWATEVLPRLHSLFLWDIRSSGSRQEDIESFLTVHQSSGQPVAIHRLGRQL
jgi:hypothetical protein